MYIENSKLTKNHGGAVSIEHYKVSDEKRIVQTVELFRTNNTASSGGGIVYTYTPCSPTKNYLKLSKNWWSDLCLFNY